MSGWFPSFHRNHTISVVALLGLALALSPVVPSVALSVQITILAAAIGVFGLPHGALDLALVRGASCGKRGALAAAVAVYLAASGAVLAAWMAAPVATLFGFLAIAVIHFGLGDTEDLDEPQRALEVIARGGFAGVAPLVFHPQTTRDLFLLLVGPAHATNLDMALSVITPVAAKVWLVTLAAALLWRLFRRGTDWLPAVAELILTTAVFVVFHPLAAFLLYFAFVHSVRHIADLGAARFPDSARHARRWLLLESLPFTVATIVLGAAAWFALHRNFSFDEAMMRVVFWGLSALTVPHMILTAWWHGRGDPRPGDLFARHV